MSPKGKRVYISITMIALVVLTTYNIKIAPEYFFKINIYHVISIALSAFFIFFMSQLIVDKRIQKEIMIKVLESIQKNTEYEKAFSIKSQDDLNLLKINKRSLNNNLFRIEKYAKKMHIEDAAEQMRFHYENYDKFIGDHESDIPYLSKSETELRKSLDLINGAAFDIMIKIYD